MSQTWSTGYEIDFLDHIGSYNVNKGEYRSRISKEKYWEKYLETLPLRFNWDGIDSGIIERHLKKLLKKPKREQPNEME